MDCLSGEQQSAYEAALAKARREWNDGSRPPPVTAVAAVLCLDPDVLDMHVEGLHGWEWHNDGYEECVWEAARCDDPACLERLSR